MYLSCNGILRSRDGVLGDKSITNEAEEPRLSTKKRTIQRYNTSYYAVQTQMFEKEITVHNAYI